MVTPIGIDILEDDIRILNPGSVSMPRDNNPGFLIIDIKDGVFDISRITTNNKEL